MEKKYVGLPGTLLLIVAVVCVIFVFAGGCLTDTPPLPENNSSNASPSGTDSNFSGTDGSIVYMTTDITSESLMAVYEALEATPEGNVAVKITTGEPGSNYLRPELIGHLVQSLNGTLVECNTAYGGSRAATAMHYQVAADHGWIHGNCARGHHG